MAQHVGAPVADSEEPADRPSQRASDGAASRIRSAACLVALLCRQRREASVSPFLPEIARLLRSPAQTARRNGIVTARSGDNHIRLYRGTGFMRAARNVAAHRALADSGMSVPPRLAAGTVRLDGRPGFAIVDRRLPWPTLHEANLDDRGAARLGAGFARWLGLRPRAFRHMGFWHRAWLDPPGLVRRSAKRLPWTELAPPLLRIADRLEAVRIRPRYTLIQSDMHPANILMPVDGTPVWLDLDEVVAAPFWYMLARLEWTYFRRRPGLLAPFHDALFAAANIAPEEWRRARHAYLGLVAARFIVGCLDRAAPLHDRQVEIARSCLHAVDVANTRESDGARLLMALDDAFRDHLSRIANGDR